MSRLHSGIYTHLYSKFWVYTLLHQGIYKAIKGTVATASASKFLVS